MGGAERQSHLHWFGGGVGGGVGSLRAVTLGWGRGGPAGGFG